jgi:hypothetical protein
MSCLFNSLGAHTQEPADVVRKRIVDFMQTNPEIGCDLTVNDSILWESGQTSKEYLNGMRQASTWGGAIEIAAFAKLYGINVCVHTIQTTHTKIIRFVTPSASKSVGVSWNGSHYEPLKSA